MTASNTSNAHTDNASQQPTPAPHQHRWDFKTGFLLSFFLFAVLNSLPFADAAKFRKALHACEKDLPRNQRCEVQGVVVGPASPNVHSVPK